MVAIANTLAASAAYYLAAQADEVVASPSSLTGSIGVFTYHVDQTKADEIEGRTVTYVSAGKYKTETVGPLSDEARAMLQQRVDDFYGQFVNAVAKGRGVSSSAVRAGYGEGRVLTAKRAVDAGLADRVGTIDDAVRRLASGKVGSRGVNAELPGGGYVIRQATLVGEHGPEEVVMADEDGFFTIDATAPVAGVDHPLPVGIAGETEPEPIDRATDDELELRRLKARVHGRR
jgi:ClpP class serine protease